MSDEHVSVMKVPNFTGRKFRVFDSQFKAVCTLNKCDEALEDAEIYWVHNPIGSTWNLD